MSKRINPTNIVNPHILGTNHAIAFIFPDRNNPRTGFYQKKNVDGWLLFINDENLLTYHTFTHIQKISNTEYHFNINDNIFFTYNSKPLEPHIVYNPHAPKSIVSCNKGHVTMIYGITKGWFSPNVNEYRSGMLPYNLNHLLLGGTMYDKIYINNGIQFFVMNYDILTKVISNVKLYKTNSIRKLSNIAGVYHKSKTGYNQIPKYESTPGFFIQSHSASLSGPPSPVENPFNYEEQLQKISGHIEAGHIEAHHFKINLDPDHTTILSHNHQVTIEIDSLNQHEILRHFFDMLPPEFRQLFDHLITRQAGNKKNNISDTYQIDDITKGIRTELSEPQSHTQSKWEGPNGVLGRIDEEYYVVYIDDGAELNGRKMKEDNTVVSGENYTIIKLQKNIYGGIYNYINPYNPQVLHHNGTNTTTTIFAVINDIFRKHHDRKILFKFDFDCTLAGVHFFSIFVGNLGKDDTNITLTYREMFRIYVNEHATDPIFKVLPSNNKFPFTEYYKNHHTNPQFKQLLTKFVMDNPDGHRRLQMLINFLTLIKHKHPNVLTLGHVPHVSHTEDEVYGTHPQSDESIKLSVIISHLRNILNGDNNDDLRKIGVDLLSEIDRKYINVDTRLRKNTDDRILDNMYTLTNIIIFLDILIKNNKPINEFLTQLEKLFKKEPQVSKKNIDMGSFIYNYIYSNNLIDAQYLIYKKESFLTEEVITQLLRKLQVDINKQHQQQHPGAHAYNNTYVGIMVHNEPVYGNVNQQHPPLPLPGQVVGRTNSGPPGPPALPPGRKASTASTAISTTKLEQRNSEYVNPYYEGGARNMQYFKLKYFNNEYDA